MNLDEHMQQELDANVNLPIYQSLWYWTGIKGHPMDEMLHDDLMEDDLYRDQDSDDVIDPENVLDIHYVSNIHGELIGVELVTAVGGPYIYLDTRARAIFGYFGNYTSQSAIETELASELVDYFDELFRLSMH